jgi:hypothetical protein
VKLQPLEYKSVLYCLSEVNCTVLSELYVAISADKFIELLFMHHTPLFALHCFSYSYKENAARVRQTFNDRPLSPLDTAIYWTEYVIRHSGAPHMRSAARDLAWYQYLLLDVSAVLFLGVVAVLAVLYFIVKKLFSLCINTRNEHKTKPKAKTS